jgi:hypothetical protein
MRRTILVVLRLLPAVGLALAVLVFFGPLVLHPTATLYSDYSDMLAEHVPAKKFLVHSWRTTGELPLWCPYTFAGAPFVHDIQVGIFYPPNAVLLLLPEGRVGAGVSWLVVFHVIVAGWSACAYARSHGLGLTASLVTAFGYMFAGKWLLQILVGGHSVLVGLAWLPLVLLFLEGAIRRRSLAWATGAGAAYALLVLGTGPQWTFYSGLLAAVWTLGEALHGAGYLGGAGRRSRQRTLTALGWWAGTGAWTVVVAAGLTAVQLLPTREALGQATRAGATASAGEGTHRGWQGIGQLFGPSAGQPAWDDRGGLAVVWVIAAVLAPFVSAGRTRYQAGIVLAIVLLSLGVFAAMQTLPGFGQFRQPVRMITLAAFPMAFLAGVTTRRLFEEATPPVRRRVLTVAGAAALVAVGLVVLEAPLRWRLGQAVHVPPYWWTLPVTVLLALWLLAGACAPGRRVYGREGMMWAALLLVDLWAITWPEVRVRDEAEVYRPSPCVCELPCGKPGVGRVLDRGGDGRRPFGLLGLGSPLALVEGVESLTGYSPLDVRRYKEYLQFLGDQDAPLQPFTPPYTFPVLDNFPVRNRPLLDLLGVRYVLQPAEPPEGPDVTERLLRDPDLFDTVCKDPQPVAYQFAAGGLRELPPYTLSERRDPMPRAFVVPEAQPLPERRGVLAALKATDFRRTVLLEDASDVPFDGVATQGEFRPAVVKEYAPNRVVIETQGEAGWLVLTDVWYPGWVCTVSGAPEPVRRANFLFRAVRVPEGTHEVVFAFEPESYRLGRAVSLSAAGVAVLVVLGGVLRRR